MRKRKSFERPEGVKSGRLVVIAAEGKETENIYFEQMKVSFHASGVQIEILRRDTNESSPEHVYRQIQDFAAKYDLDEDDQLWAVVDKRPVDGANAFRGSSKVFTEQTFLFLCQ